MAEWIDVNEKLPLKTEWVLVFADGAVNCMAWNNGRWENWGECCNVIIGEITHWMPLPEPPK